MLSIAESANVCAASLLAGWNVMMEDSTWPPRPEAPPPPSPPRQPPAPKRRGESQGSRCGSVAGAECGRCTGGSRVGVH